MVDCLLFIFRAYLIFPFTSLPGSVRLYHYHKKPLQCNNKINGPGAVFLFSQALYYRSKQLLTRHIDNTPQLPTEGTFIVDRINFITTGRVFYTVKNLSKL
jgi:hypothetical protein